MQGGWARRQGRDLRAGGGGAGRRLRGVGCSISTTHGVVNEHAKNCINVNVNVNVNASASGSTSASASASTNTVKYTNSSSVILEQNDDSIHSARAKAGTGTMIAEARRRPAESCAAITPTSAALLLPRGGRHARTRLHCAQPPPLPCLPCRRHGDDGTCGRWQRQRQQ